MYKTKNPISSKIMDFPDPFMTFSNIIYPTTVEEVFRWADRLWMRDGLYSQAIKKCVRYFLNDIDLVGDDLSHDTRKKYQAFLLEQMNILDQLAQVGDDVIAYGNSFTSVSVPITRSLVCPECGLSRPLSTLIKDTDFTWKDFTFVGDCPQCSKKALVFKRMDVNSVSPSSKIKVIRWAPQQISIKHCSITGESDYSYEIPAEERTAIKDGEDVFLRTMPWELIQAVKNEKPFNFNKETFYHLRCNTAANLLPTLKGWGLPLFMSNFSQVVHLQILERFNEAIAMDHIMPFRLLTPPAQGGSAGLKTDPMLSNNMGNFMGTVRNMVKQHRMDPTTWHTLPFPLQYQAIGGEAKKLVPVELIDRAQDILLTSMGVPQEFYRGSISMQTGPPISLRMFEKTWTHYTTMLDDWLGWFMGQCSRIMQWEGNITGKLERTSVMEDDMGKQVKLNLASAKVISNRTALKAFGLDQDRERSQIIEEDRIMQELMREEQRKEENTMMMSEQMAPIPPGASDPNMGMPMEGGGVPAPGAGAPVGGAPMPPMGSAPLGAGSPTLEGLMEEANQAAQQIMAMDPTTRRNELTTLKKSNPTLHAQVKQIVSDTEQGIKSDALAQAKMQAGQGG